MYFIYFIKSKVNNKIYTGQTSQDVGRRLKEHNVGSNIWTKANGPFKLVYYESFVCKTDAILKEKYYKSGVGRKVRDLIIEAFGD